ncbi:MAG: hypothetical protein ACOC6G_00360 [Thermoproteota archaeon]
MNDKEKDNGLDDFQEKLTELWGKYQNQELDHLQFILEVKKLEKELKAIAKKHQIDETE